MGKTRMALQLAQDQQEHTDVHFVALETIVSAEQFAMKLAETLGLETSGQDVFETVQASIGTDAMLLILDNFEHIMDGADYLPDLLANCPNLTLLVTSRERLNLEEEYVFTLEGSGLSR